MILNSAKFRVLQAISRNVPAPLDEVCTTALVECMREKLVLLQREPCGKPKRYVATEAGLAALQEAS